MGERWRAIMRRSWGREGTKRQDTALRTRALPLPRRRLSLKMHCHAIWIDIFQKEKANGATYLRLPI